MLHESALSCLVRAESGQQSVLCQPVAKRVTLALALISVVLCCVVPFIVALRCRYAVLRDDDLIEAISEWDGKKLVLQALQQR